LRAGAVPFLRIFTGEASRATVLAPAPEYVRIRALGLPAALEKQLIELFGENYQEEIFNLETWKGLWYMVNYTIQYQADFFGQSS